MCQLIKAITITALFSTVDSLKPLAHVREEPQNTNALHHIISKVRRYDNKDNLETIRGLFRKITKEMKPDEVKDWLRNDGSQKIPVPVKPEILEEVDVPLDQAALVEAELKNVLQDKKPALLDFPYVETKGKKDFLVLRPEVLDPFVTVIPNAIYYSIEKKCVNWLDDCSLKGIRARLLRGVQSPYR